MDYVKISKQMNDLKKVEKLSSLTEDQREYLIMDCCYVKCHAKIFSFKWNRHTFKPSLDSLKKKFDHSFSSAKTWINENNLTITEINAFDDGIEVIGHGPISDEELIKKHLLNLKKKEGSIAKNKKMAIKTIKQLSKEHKINLNSVK